MNNKEIMYRDEAGDIYTQEELYDEWQKQVADGYFESDDPLASNFNLWLREITGKNGTMTEIKSTTKINASDSTYTVSRVSFQIQDGIIAGYFEEDEMDTFDDESEAIDYAKDYSKDEIYSDTGYVVTENGDLYDGTIIWADYPIGSEYEEPDDVDPDWLDTLIRAMAAAGYYYDDIAGGTPSGNQTDIKFDMTYDSVYFDSWNDVYDWLTDVVFDDPEISDEVDRILNSYE